MSIFSLLECGFAARNAGAKLMIFATVLATALLAQPAQAHATQTSTVLNCDIDKGSCSQKAGASLVTLDVLPKPVQAMQDLTFTVNLKGMKDFDRLKLDLQMVGMNMGPNEVTLVKTGPGRYSGHGIIPRCHSGKKLWSATVALPGSPSEISFLFNVL